MEVSDALASSCHGTAAVGQCSPLWVRSAGLNGTFCLSQQTKLCFTSQSGLRVQGDGECTPCASGVTGKLELVRRKNPWKIHHQCPRFQPLVIPRNTFCPFKTTCQPRCFCYLPGIAHRKLFLNEKGNHSCGPLRGKRRNMEKNLFSMLVVL